MLLKVRVANVRSLRDEQELSFVAPPTSREAADDTLPRTREPAGGKTVAVLWMGDVPQRNGGIRKS